MGYSEDVMHDIIRKDVTKVFSPVDGWTSNDHSFTNNRWKGVLLTRRSLKRMGMESILILVNFDQKTGLDAIKALQEEPVPGVTTGVNRVLMVPKDADTSQVPRDIMVIPMQSFGFEEKNLVWFHKYRHNPKPSETVKS